MKSAINNIFYIKKPIDIVFETIKSNNISSMSDEKNIDIPINEQLQLIVNDSNRHIEGENEVEFLERKHQQTEVLKLFNVEAFNTVKASIIAEATRLDVDPKEIIKDSKRLKGALFETFTLVEYETKYMKKPADENTLNIGLELAYLHKFPPKNLEKKLEYMRNPDLIEIETDTNHTSIIISKTVETTTDRLGIRKFAQLTETEDALREIIELLDEIPQEYAEKYTPNLLRYRGNIKVKQNIDRTLILSADKKLELRASFLDEEIQSSDNHQMLYELLDELDNVEVISSAFSSADIEDYMSFFASKLEKSL